MSKFTPGPWFTGPTPGYLRGGQEKDGRSRHYDPITIRSAAHTEEIATVWTYLLPTPANANLIASAPDLYEALVGLLKIADELDRGAYEGMRVSGEEWDAARAALAKADGVL